MSIIVFFNITLMMPMLSNSMHFHKILKILKSSWDIVVRLHKTCFDI